MLKFEFTPFISEQIEKGRRWAFEDCFCYICKTPYENLTEKYQKNFIAYCRRHNLPVEQINLDFPNPDFQQKIIKEYEENSQNVKQLLAQCSLLSYHILPKQIKEKRRTLTAQQQLQSRELIINIHSSDVLLLSDGRILHATMKNEDFFEPLKQLAQKIGLSDVRPEKVSLPFYNMLENYAVNQKIDTFEAVDLPGIDTLVKECFADNATLLTATAEYPTDSHERRRFALFSNGWLVCAPHEDIPYHMVSKFKKIILLKSYVPAEYLDALYEHASSQKDFIQPVLKKEPVTVQTDDEVQKLETERQTYRCLSFNDGLINLNEAMLFDDGVIVISNKFGTFAQNSVKSSAILTYGFNEEELRLIVVPENIFTCLYSKIKAHAVTFREIYLEMLKQYAKKFKKTHNVTHTEALEAIAKLQGFSSWRDVCKIDEQNAELAVKKEKEKREFYSNIIEKPLKENLQNPQLLQKALDDKAKTLSHNKISYWIDFIALPFDTLRQL